MIAIIFPSKGALSSPEAAKQGLNYAFYARNWHVPASFELMADGLHGCCPGCGMLGQQRKSQDSLRYNHLLSCYRSDIMARPKSEDKRNAIINAAIQEFAIRGVWATPTSVISKSAGIAEGTLFTYFPTKKNLINVIYCDLKNEIAEITLDGFSQLDDPREKFFCLWNNYVRWGVINPLKIKVMGQLRLSEQITQESRAAGMAPFSVLIDLMQKCIQDKILRDLPVNFIGMMMGALTETTIEFVARNEGGGIDYSAAGFDTLWRGLLPSDSEE